MSEQSQGPGWWQASDGRWYPPESAPAGWTQPGQTAQPGYGQPDASTPSAYGQPAYGQPGYAQPGYGQAVPPYAQAGAYGYGSSAAPQKTNGMAIASLVLGILGFICFVGAISAIVAIILGIGARRKIRESDGTEKGEGMALAGIILGAVFLVLQIGFFALAVTGSSNNNNSNNGLVRPSAHVLVVDGLG